MFFRFAVAVVVVTILSLLAISLEKQNLAFKRSISLQHDHLQIVKEKRCRLLLTIQTLGAPPRLMEEFHRHGVEFEESRIRPDADSGRMLEWRLNGR